MSRILHKTLAEIEALPTSEIYLQMAYDLTQNEEWSEQRRKNKELEASRQMTAEEKSQAFRKAMGKH